MTRHPSRDWSAKGEPFSRPEDDEADAIEARALSILDRLDPQTADVLRVQGRHVSDRRAAETLDKRDHVESSQAIAAHMPRRPLWSPRQVAPLSEQRRREIQTAARPRPGDFQGTGRETDAAKHKSWRTYLSGRHGLDLDDARYDAWLDEQGAVCRAEDLHVGSPDLDDIPEQQTVPANYVQEHAQ